MKTSIIEQALLADLLGNCKYITCNYFFKSFECDVLTVTKQGYLSEYEIKVSRSDFLKDAKKEWKHKNLRDGKRTTRFFYVCPDGLIKPDELPDGYGLIYVKERYCSYHKKLMYDLTHPISSKRFRKTPATAKEIEEMTRVLSIKYVANLLKQLRTQNAQ